MKPRQQSRLSQIQRPSRTSNYILTRLRLKSAVKRIIAEQRLLDKTSKKFQNLEIAQESNAGTREKELKSEILARFLYRDELDQISIPRRRIYSQNVKLEHVDQVQSGTTTSGPVPCTVTNELDGTRWVPDGKVVKCKIGGGEGLYLWQLAGDMSGDQAFVFGYKDDSDNWMYVTAYGLRRPLRFKTHPIGPNEINSIEDDPRTFYGNMDTRTSSSGIRLVSAKFQNSAINVGSGGRLVLTSINSMNNILNWVIEEQ